MTDTLKDKCQNFIDAVLDREFKKHKAIFEKAYLAAIIGHEMPKVKVSWDEETNDIKMEIVE